MDSETLALGVVMTDDSFYVYHRSTQTQYTVCSLMISRLLVAHMMAAYSFGTF